MPGILNSAQTILVTLGIIGILVFIHELGHLLAAKSVGVKVLKFGIGFGPVLFKRQIGETEYSLRLFFLGGFVQMYGDEDVTSTIQDKSVAKDPHAYQSKTVLQKLWITSAGVIMNFIFGVICFAIYLAAVGNATALPKIGNFSFMGANVRPYALTLFTDFELNKPSQGFVLEINGEVPTSEENLVSILERNYNRTVNVKLFNRYKVEEKRLVLNGDGIASNLDLDFFPQSSTKDSSGFSSQNFRLIIGAVQPDSALAKAQIREQGGSAFVALQPELLNQAFVLELNSTPVNQFEYFTQTLEANLGKEINLKLLAKDKKIYEVVAQLPAQKPENQGILGVNGLSATNAGLSTNVNILTYSNALTGGFSHTLNILGYQVYALPYLIGEAFNGRPEQLTQNVGSVVLIGDEIGNILNISRSEGASFLIYLVNLTGSFSIALAFMNILPIPLFDGGHVFFILLEKLRGKPVAVNTMEIIYKIFFGLLILLGILVIGKDLLSLLNRPN